ncbi:hypothetical protein OSTOST_12770, partial [Ostertagia ostertagi]
MDLCRRHTNTQSETRPSSRKDHALRLVGLGGHRALGNSREEQDEDLHVGQLRRVNEALQMKRRNRERQVILLHDNARPHTASVAKITLQELGWEILQHPPYSHDLAPTDFLLFRSLSNHISGEHFENGEHLENWLKNFFDSKTNDFWTNGFNKLADS